MTANTQTQPNEITSAVDLLTEDLLSLPEARLEVPGTPHVSTLHRWRLRGIGGVRLETIRIGGRILTSRQSLARFLTRLQ